MDDETQDITQGADAQVDTEPLDSEPAEARERWFRRHPRARNAAVVAAVVSIVSIGWLTFATIGVMAGEARFRETTATDDASTAESRAVAEQAAKLRAEKKASGAYYPSPDAVPLVLAQGPGRIEGSGERIAAADETAADRQVAQVPPPPLPAPTTSEESDEADEADTDEAAVDTDESADEPADTSTPALPTTGLGPDQ